MFTYLRGLVNGYVNWQSFRFHTHSMLTYLRERNRLHSCMVLMHKHQKTSRSSSKVYACSILTIPDLSKSVTYVKKRSIYGFPFYCSALTRINYFSNFSQLFHLLLLSMFSRLFHLLRRMNTPCVPPARSNFQALCPQLQVIQGIDTEVMVGTY